MSHSVEQFVQSAFDAGCPREQLENFIRARVILQPKQLIASAAARSCDLPGGPTDLGFGGARGGGKSHWGFAQVAVDDCQRFPGLKCLFLRKVGKSARESLEDLRQSVLRYVPHEYKRQDGVILFPNGSRIILGHFQTESDIDAYLGIEYDVILVEEATTLSSSKYRAIRTCCRTSKPWRPRMYTTTNPGNIGHAWYKAMFVEPFRKGKETTTVFIPATVYDNTFVNPEYRATLEGLTGWQRKAWLLGDWDIAAGQYFTTFRRDVHVIPAFGIPLGWRKWGALDYGFTHFTSVHLFAQNGDGDLFVFDEHGERSWLPPRHFDAITAMLGRHGLKMHHLDKFVAGADVFAKRPDGGTVSDTYQKLGIKFTAANDDRINGAAEILTRLGDVEATDIAGKPKPIQPTIYIFERCARLIETIPAMQHDPHRPEDVLKVDCDDDGLGGDDFYDDFRYGTMEGVRRITSAPVTGGQRTAVAGFRPR